MIAVIVLFIVKTNDKRQKGIIVSMHNKNSPNAQKKRKKKEKKVAVD